MDIEIIFPLASRTLPCQVHEDADNNEIADLVVSSFQSLFKLRSTRSAEALFDLCDDDGLVNWAKYKGFTVAHGVMKINSIPLLEFWVRVYE